MLCFFAAPYTQSDLVKQSDLLMNSFTYSQIERGSRPFDWNKVLRLSQIQMVLSMSSWHASSSLRRIFFFFVFPYLFSSKSSETFILKCRHLVEIAGGRDNNDRGEWVCKDKQLFPWWKSVTLPCRQGFSERGRLLQHGTPKVHRTPVCPKCGKTAWKLFFQHRRNEQTSQLLQWTNMLDETSLIPGRTSLIKKNKKR